MVKSKGPVFERVFGLCYQYKRYWYNKGRDTPIMNRLLFNKVNSISKCLVVLLMSKTNYDI